MHSYGGDPTAQHRVHTIHICKNQPGTSQCQYLTAAMFSRDLHRVRMCHLACVNLGALWALRHIIING